MELRCKAKIASGGPSEEQLEAGFAPGRLVTKEPLPPPLLRGMDPSACKLCGGEVRGIKLVIANHVLQQLATSAVDPKAAVVREKAALGAPARMS